MPHLLQPAGTLNIMPSCQRKFILIFKEQEEEAGRKKQEDEQASSSRLAHQMTDQLDIDLSSTSQARQWQNSGRCFCSAGTTVAERWQKTGQ